MAKENKERASERIEMRVTKEQKNIIEQASKVGGYMTVSSFILTEMLETSRKVIVQSSIFKKSLEANKKFVESMTNEELEEFMAQFDNEEIVPHE